LAHGESEILKVVEVLEVLKVFQKSNYLGSTGFGPWVAALAAALSTRPSNDVTRGFSRSHY
jgi:hypothetical protein